jgi:hypothetical protein
MIFKFINVFINPRRDKSQELFRFFALPCTPCGAGLHSE